MYYVPAPKSHRKSSKFLSKTTSSCFFYPTLLKSLRDSPSSGPEIMKNGLLFPFSRNTIETPTRFAPLVSNDPHLESKVVTDEPGRLGRPAERAGRAWPARAGQPGRPVPPASRWAALQGGGKREGQRRGAAHRPNPAPPLLSPQVGYFVCHEEHMEEI